MMETVLKDASRRANTGSSPFSSHNQPADMMTTAATIDRNHWTCESENRALKLPCNVLRYSRNGKAPMIMKTVAMESIQALSKYPIEPSEVENPPVAMVVMAWAKASNPFIPASQ